MTNIVKLVDITLDDNGQIVLTDEELIGLINLASVNTAGGNGEINTFCSNFSSCHNSTNGGGCTNTQGQCEGSKNGFLQCRVVNQIEV